MRRKLARWRRHQFEFVFHIVHRAGVNRQAADALSLLLTGSTDNISLEIELPFQMIASS